ncbi:phosphotransferase [Mycobacterium koreense]|uniref:Uncharacterized protein n=1 Tax=Mycolicibacillus koreensis TaxID=1069220 RepID=A0A7I7SIK4_9MYCO|nr:phosphotransferase [Mycolicibacillus koreensis]MCV7249685.1 phosphotransferase [Mycolicibacillus koreensis]OSC32974.1 hypothetical protein B8W67_12970 [Mycolicibacillus koreensis]BBY56797.1 aminoglycoside phosphotransferase APH(3') [Mycolicibacillus koreensis]
MSAQVPETPPDIPGKVVELAGADPIAAVWRNELGGWTFRACGRRGTRYIKWQPYAGLDSGRRGDVDLLVESEKLRWAAQFIAVPRVLDGGEDDDHAWLVTEGIDAIPAADPRWRDTPDVAVRAIATGLRRIHDALPVDTCPYRGAWLGSKAPPEPERLVVCHGDPCVPNTLMNRDGEFAGHVDLARLGVADRWADLAIATYSISWEVNFGRRFDELFFQAYGVKPDDERIRTYRERWDAQ